MASPLDGRGAADSSRSGHGVGEDACARCAVLEHRVARLTSVLDEAGLAMPADLGETTNGDGASPRASGLTTREYEVGQLAAQGLTNVEIAEALYIGRNSVKTHLQGLYRALGVRNRTEAALCFVRTPPGDVLTDDTSADGRG